LRSPDENDWLILYVLAAQVAGLIQHGLSDGPPLTYRGCIAFGEYHVEGPFIIGQAVDDAGEGHEAAEGAIVWLHATALAVTDGHVQGTRGSTPFVPLNVPLKRRSMPCPTLVVNPFWFLDSSAHDDFIGATLDTFTGSNEGITRKRENTKWFLNRCRGG
ncbi:MAG: hypothetical protein ACHREM_20675, partial [Polyangiales bacterium]